MRILALDYGSKRIGVALSDELGMTARGLTTIVRKGRPRDMERISSLVDEYGVETVVIGYPLRLDGTEGIQCKKVSRYAEILGAHLSIPVVTWDESLSTKEAEDILIEANMKRRKRRDVVDKVAAAIILQGYLDSLNREKAEDLPQ